MGLHVFDIVRLMNVLYRQKYDFYDKSKMNLARHSSLSRKANSSTTNCIKIEKKWIYEKSVIKDSIFAPQFTTFSRAQSKNSNFNPLQQFSVYSFRYIGSHSLLTPKPNRFFQHLNCSCFPREK
jgi:hypothetical protein